MEIIFSIIILIFAVVIHEVSHGYMAEYLGDPTARLAGRLTLNPIKHLELFGSFLVPVSLWILTSGTMVFGWAKPVPYNPYNLRNPVSGGAKIAAAGPLSNFLIALVFAIAFRILAFMQEYAGSSSYDFLFMAFAEIVKINILLAVFNLVPIPPLDGSRLLPIILPKSETSARIINFLEQNGFIFLIIFLLFGFELILPIVLFLIRFFLFFPT